MFSCLFSTHQPWLVSKIITKLPYSPTTVWIFLFVLYYFNAIYTKCHSERIGIPKSITLIFFILKRASENTSDSNYELQNHFPDFSKGVKYPSRVCNKSCQTDDVGSATSALTSTRNTRRVIPRRGSK